MEDLLDPKLHILPPSQLTLWHELSSTPKDFILYGETALALRLGHRVSVDFDFFSSTPFDPEVLYKTIPYLQNARIIQQTRNTLTCMIDRNGEVLISFFGGLTIRQIAKPSLLIENQLRIASLFDLAGTKAAVIQKRVEMKDYLDINALLTLGNLTLETILACGNAVYGKTFNPFITLKAMSYFSGPELIGLPSEIKERFTKAVQEVNLTNIPKLTDSALGS